MNNIFIYRTIYFQVIKKKKFYIISTPFLEGINGDYFKDLNIDDTIYVDGLFDEKEINYLKNNTSFLNIEDNMFRPSCGFGMNLELKDGNHKKEYFLERGLIEI